MGESVHIHILQAVKPRGLRSSKDTNGGYGTVNDFGHGLVPGFLKILKRSTMEFPELLPAYIYALARQQGYAVTFGINQVHPHADILLIQTSIVNFNAELSWAERVRREYPAIRIGFVGGMAAGNPQLYLPKGDFVVVGEVEKAFLSGDIAEFSGLVNCGLVDNLDEIPFPDWSYLPRQTRRYGLLRTRSGLFLPVLSSRGCPMSCAYYCTYPLTQGANFRARSPENVVAEIEHLQDHYGMTTVMFRDPIFSLKMGRVQRICELILQKGLKFTWICETHPRFLNPELIGLMAQAGCTTVKLGIEAANLEVMKKAQRAAPDLASQEEIVHCLEQQHIDVLAFYILGYFDDTAQTVAQTMQYAEHLNTYGAQFTVATPYPGTQWHRDLQSQVDQLDEDLENYTQYKLVYHHPHLSSADLEGLKSTAYRRYYLRWDYVKKHFLKRL
jgi:anaerobic magnesium-protoporphyrin IX monomethyl ester cyclase